MAASQTDRLDIFTWSAGTDTFTRTQMNTSHTNLEARAAAFDQTAATVPTAKTIDKYKGYFHYSTSNTDVGTLSYCNGAAWFEIGKYGTAVAIDGTLANGSSTDVARADHKHSISSNTITTAMIQAEAVETAKIDNLAVTTAKIAATAVTNAKLGSDLDASKITAGTLPIARIASSAVTNVKLGSDIDAGKITAGTLPIARIATSAVTHEKIENSAGLSVIGRSANSSGVVADITAGNDNEVLLRNGTSLEFGKIDTDNITANAVDVEQMQQVAGHAILGRVGSSTANLTQITSGDEEVLGRTGGGNLAFGKVTNAQLNGSITTDKITSLDAAKLTGDIASARIPNNTVTLGTQTVGNYVETVAAGSGLSVSGSDSEGSTKTIGHSTTGGSSIYGSGGTVVQAIGIDANGHVTATGSVDLDSRYYQQADARGLFTDSTRKSYGGSTSPSTRNSTAYHNIFVTGSTPTTTSAKAGDLWFET